MSHNLQSAADKALEAQAENRIAVRLLLGVVVLIVLVAGAVTIWGLPALAMVGLAASALMLLLLVAYAAGF